MVKKIYRKIVPQKSRERIYQAFLGRWLYLIRKNITEPIKYKVYYRVLFKLRDPKNRQEQALKEWSLVAPSHYPYLWIREYYEKKREIRVSYLDELPYVEHEKKKLFFPRDMSASQVVDVYVSLLIEQDKRSAHRYVEDYDELIGRVLLDIGCAEAIFTLQVIEKIRHAYLFEIEERWIEALNATFAPWNEKITIVKKYVGDIDDEQNVRLDTYFHDKPIDGLFLKMDIEGSERKALQGACDLLISAKDIRGAVCIYHRPDDPDIISRMLTKSGQTINVVPGWLYISNSLRPAICRFCKKV